MAYVTLAQIKQYLDIEDYQVFTADEVSAANDTITLTGVKFVNNLNTGDEVELSNSGAVEDLPEPLDDDTIYYVIKESGQIIKLATSSANASAGTQIDLTDGGTGTHTLTRADSDDALLEALIDAAQTKIETETRRVFEAAADTRYYGAEALDGQSLWLDYDLYSLTSIANGDSNSTAISTDDVTLWPRNWGPPYHRIRLNEGSTSVWEQDTDYWIEITGTWGYSESAPNDIVLATKRLVAYYYRQKDAGQFESVGVQEGGVLQVPQGFPNSVTLLIDPYRRR